MTGFCGNCGRRWTGLAEAHCASCCEHFTSDAAFDRHLASALSDREVCHDPATLRDRYGRRVLEGVDRKAGRAWKRRDRRAHYFAAKGEASVSDSPGSDSGDGYRAETSETDAPAQMAAMP